MIKKEKTLVRYQLPSPDLSAWIIGDMKYQNITRTSLVGVFTIAGSLSLALEPGKKPNTPKLPDVDYVVHDGTRPQPRKVKAAGPVVVKAPSDAKILFDGKNTDAWNSPWPVKDGAMIASGKGTQTKEKFGDCQFHMEWRIPADRKVDGQKGGNSGVFFMNRYEIQVLASHTNKTYPDGQAGAIYGQSPPLVNASTPKGEWQSYDIIFKAPRYDGETCVSPAKVTVLHNGVLLHHNKAYSGPSGYKKLSTYPAKHPAKDSIGLQFHGDPVEYRNIWIREIGKYDEK